MKRKSKGQLAREAKKEKEANELLKDPWFSSLPQLVQLKLAGFVRKELDRELTFAQWAGYEDGMIDCMACVIQVLGEDYWKKSPTKKWNKFVFDISELMNSHLRDTVTWEEMREYIKDKTGMEIKRKYSGMDIRPTPKDLFGEAS